jgi:DNA-binding NtrC family response regulator
VPAASVLQESRVGFELSRTSEDSLRRRPGTALAARPYLFVVLDGTDPLAGGARYTLEAINEVHVGRGERRAVRIEEGDGGGRMVLELPSRLLSRLHARLRRGPGGWIVEDAGSRNGTYVNGERVAQALVGPADLVEAGHVYLTVRSFDQPVDEATADLDGVDLAHEAAAFRTLSPAVAAELEILRRAARAEISILLVGESGTGKEVLARAIHEHSGRPGPFVAVNCNTLKEGLAESLLFGHVRGAFSGAVTDSVGFVRAADRGTLLLDEVQDLGAAAQGALLRVVQEREVVPVGKAVPLKVDVRFVATSPRSLDPAIAGERFRSDLFARLTGFVHAMTPLRDRREDLGLLVAALLAKAGVGPADRPRFAPDLALALLTHRWPLNVRELEQLLTRTWLLAEDGLMSGAPLLVGAGTPDPGAGAPLRSERALSPEEQEERRRLLEALEAAHGNVTEAARALGKGRVQMHRLMRRLAIDARRFRP